MPRVELCPGFYGRSKITHFIRTHNAPISRFGPNVKTCANSKEHVDFAHPLTLGASSDAFSRLDYDPQLNKTNEYTHATHRVQLVRWVAQEPLVRGSKPLRC